MDEVLHIKIEKELKEQLRKEATEKGISSLNSYIRMLLLERKK